MYTPITIDKPRRLRFDVQACFDLEIASGQTLAETVFKLQRASIVATVYTLWAGLKHEDEALSVADVRRLLQAYLAGGGTLKTVIETLGEAIDRASPVKSATVPEGNVPSPETPAIVS